MGARSKFYKAVASHEGRLVKANDDMGDKPKGFTPPHQKEIGAPTQRKIPTDHKFDPKALKPLVKMLWASSVALGHTLTAHRQFSRLKSVAFSPDGLVGGQGYVLSVKAVRAKLYEAGELLSTICDSIYDEVNGPHWKPKMAELDKADESDVLKLLDDATDYMEDPEGEAAEDMEEVEDGPAPKHKPAGFAPKRMKNEEDKSKGSRIPGGGSEANTQGPQPARFDRPQMKEARRVRTANSSLPVNSLPGPRVDHLDRGDQTGPFGSYNRNESLPTDGWGRDEGVGNDYLYTSEGENDLSGKSASGGVLQKPGIHEYEVNAGPIGVSIEVFVPEPYERSPGSVVVTANTTSIALDDLRDFDDEILRAVGRSLGKRASWLERDWGRGLRVGEVTRHVDVGVRTAASHVPDSNTDPTATEGYDFGIGRGNGDEASGEGAGGYGESNPSTGNKGVYGPRSGLPWDPGGKTHDDASDSNAVVENATSGRSIPTTASALLPLDVLPPVARSDYYAGPKGNDLDIVTGETAESLLPNDNSDSSYESLRTTGPNIGYRYERPDVPYKKMDYTTTQMRPDWTNQRDPIQGPYRK